VGIDINRRSLIRVLTGLSTIPLIGFVGCTTQRQPGGSNGSLSSRPLPTPNSPGKAVPVEPRSVLLVAAGDIACNPANEKFKDLEGDETGCRHKATSELVLKLHPDAVMPLGDEQYQRGTYNGFMLSYGPTWGRMVNISHPVVGNHEYLTPGASGYFKYFGVLAGDSDKGYYSFELGSWHIVVLNSECPFVAGGCGYGSPQEKWLRADLSAHPAHCTLAAFHEPRWSSGDHESNGALDPFWRDLSAAKAEVVLSGHDHDYERFAAFDANGDRDARHGTRQFVVGTGGVGLRPFDDLLPGSEVHQNTAFGVLALTLDPSGYTWRFVSVDSSFSDSGRGDCH
jgi:hypothetical protein